MPEKQKDYPNLWSGADLGGHPGAGRKPNVVRRLALKGAEHGTKWVAAVAEGRKVVPVVAKSSGEVSGYRFPTIDELKWAIEYCAKIGVPTRTENVIANDAVFEALGRMLPCFVAVDQVAPFLSRLKEELGDES